MHSPALVYETSDEVQWGFRETLQTDLLLHFHEPQDPQGKEEGEIGVLVLKIHPKQLGNPADAVGDGVPMEEQSLCRQGQVHAGLQVGVQGRDILRAVSPVVIQDRQVLRTAESFQSEGGGEFVHHLVTRVGFIQIDRALVMKQLAVLLSADPLGKKHRKILRPVDSIADSANHPVVVQKAPQGLPGDLSPVGGFSVHDPDDAVVIDGTGTVPELRDHIIQQVVIPVALPLVGPVFDHEQIGASGEIESGLLHAGLQPPPVQFAVQQLQEYGLAHRALYPPAGSVSQFGEQHFFQIVEDLSVSAAKGLFLHQGDEAVKTALINQIRGDIPHRGDAFAHDGGKGFLRFKGTQSGAPGQIADVTLRIIPGTDDLGQKIVAVAVASGIGDHLEAFVYQEQRVFQQFSPCGDNGAAALAGEERVIQGAAGRLHLPELAERGAAALKRRLRVGGFPDRYPAEAGR